MDDGRCFGDLPSMVLSLFDIILKAICVSASTLIFFAQNGRSMYIPSSDAGAGKYGKIAILVGCMLVLSYGVNFESPSRWLGFPSSTRCSREVKRLMRLRETNPSLR